MDFTQRKLPLSAASKLRICPVSSVVPYALVLAPIYVFLKRNGKFISIKGPLDFFTPQELARFRPLQNFYLPLFIDSTESFRQAARSVRLLLKWTPSAADSSQKKYPLPKLPISPYELSDAVLRLVGPLWAKGNQIEPFFVSVFANELCDYLPGSLLKSARERSVKHYELAIFRSSWAVFLALHLGMCDLKFINQLRYRVFVETVSGKTLYSEDQTEIDELIRVANESCKTLETRLLSSQLFEKRSDRTSLKLVNRLRRVEKELIQGDSQLVSIFGSGGFIDV